MRRRVAVICLGALMLMGTAVYLRLWTIDYSITSGEAQLLRRQFDLASREAMDESAEWRKRYDEEADKARTCSSELAKLKPVSTLLSITIYQSVISHQAVHQRHLIKALNGVGSKKKLEMLQKENAGLIERIETLKLDLEAEKLRCSMRQS
ncbi:hypothetical protein LIER_04446 [Lithospermum erythrorhizon]|uniref:Uncharacterized protein n=1 Tax=Lithospermum erythrorhizon TaxID=34254 RepID=A0AAV3NY47_LITER